jgi:hypothetical protein
MPKANILVLRRECAEEIRRLRRDIQRVEDNAFQPGIELMKRVATMHLRFMIYR